MPVPNSTKDQEALNVALNQAILDGASAEPLTPQTVQSLLMDRAFGTKKTASKAAKMLNLKPEDLSAFLRVEELIAAGAVPTAPMVNNAVFADNPQIMAAVLRALPQGTEIDKLAPGYARASGKRNSAAIAGQLIMYIAAQKAPAAAQTTTQAKTQERSNRRLK